MDAKSFVGSVGDLALSTTSAASVPSAPSLTATAGNAKVILSWSAPSSNGGSTITMYRIWRGMSAESLSVVTTRGNILTWTDTSVVNGKAYYYKVAAINSAGVGTPSNVASATPSSGTSTSSALPPAPQNLIAIAGSTMVVLSWSAPASNGGSSITSYKVYRVTTSGAKTLIGTTSRLTYTDTGLTNGVTYHYKVSAVNSIGEGPLSDEGSATPATTGTTAPSSNAVFTVYSSSGTYYAKKTSTGTTVYSGTNAATVIQSAINALTSGRTIKQKVSLQGTFSITSTIYLPSYTTLELDGTVTKSSGYLVSSTGKSHVDVIGGVWRNYQTGEGVSIFFSNCYDVKISDCDVYGCGISVRDCRDVLITRNSVSNVPAELCQGILVHNTASDIEISYNTISNSRGGGIYVFQRSDGTAKTAKNVWVHHNTLTSIFTDGISLYPEGSINRCQYCTVEYNTITNAGNSGRHTALAVGWGGGSALTAGQGCDYNTIKGNTVVRSGNITLGGYLNVRGDHNLVSSNTIINAQKTAIIMLHANNNTFEGNVVEGTELDSANAFTGTGSSYNSIKNNQFLNPNNNCIQLKLSTYGIACNHNIISGNTMDSPRVCWIYINETANSNNRIMGNYFKNPSFAFPSGIVDIGTNTIIFNNTYL